MEKENDFLKELILDINNSKLNIVKRSLMNRTFELSLNTFLLNNLHGWIGAYIIRTMCFELGINEHHIFKWRPENKYIQYLILNHYARGCMPKTLSLTALLEKSDWAENIRMLIKSGYFIKATLSFGSGATNSFDKTTGFEQILRNHQRNDSFSNEKWIVQKWLNISKEFRIHTFGKDILYGLTLIINGSNEINDFDQPQAFVNSILQKLPSSFMEGSLIGWDVGLTKKGKLYVIEANFTGYHPVYYEGFQTTGYVGDPFCGPIVCALLHVYFRNKHAISIVSAENFLMEKFPYLAEFFYYSSLFNEEFIEVLLRAKGRVKAIYIYLGEKTEFHIIKLVGYMQMANFADTIFIITNEELQEEAHRQFKGERIIHLVESSLFTEDLYKQIQRKDYEIKKKECYSHLTRLTSGQSCIFL
ncbi:hypothetical protein HDE68_003099 [Pedobacter cryoconitis]|uniref:Uncharacterized protein n=1 Tax=Pedobacter cryoconitis TaxID=188932 RepID=A0A7W8ZNB9_9SPHI|nr:hypothetical protein [Pedobacter cryoconitis]MBB5637186.1 hypothetical protein [Pedobacter cryoconitis]